MLEIKHIYKSYGNKKVLNNITLSLDYGIYGLLGVNGAGKTTLINIITGLLEADKGEIWYQGESVKKNKKRFRNHLGFMPQYADYYSNFTAKEFLKYMCVIKGIPPKKHKIIISELLEKVNLTEETNKKIGTFSGGMRQRIGIAQAIINEPKLLILDEPTAGLDPIERIRFRELISNLAVERTIIMATHIVQDIEPIAYKVILLHGGNILACEKPEQLVTKEKGKVGLEEYFLLKTEAGGSLYENTVIF